MLLLRVKSVLACFEVVVEAPGDVAFEAPAGLARCFPFTGFLLEVGAGFGVVADPVDRDDVKSLVEFSVSAAWPSGPW